MATIAEASEMDIGEPVPGENATITSVTMHPDELAKMRLDHAKEVATLAEQVAGLKAALTQVQLQRNAALDKWADAAAAFEMLKPEKAKE